MSVSHDNRSDVQKTGSVGSMIINPLLFDMTCETTGGLRFVHEHEFADMETENRLVVDCKDFGNELTDTGCVLARSCDSCTRESECSELTDMGCVLAKSCDSCTHESEEDIELADTGCVLARGCDSCTRESGEDELADWVVCWQEVATAVLMSQSLQKMNWLTRVVCWQEVGTAVLVSQKI